MAHGILQTQVVQTTFERITGDVDAAFSTVAFVRGDLVKSNFEWTLTTKDSGDRRVVVGGANVTTSISTLEAVNVVDRNDGTYKIHFVPASAGLRTMSVHLNGVLETHMVLAVNVTFATCDAANGARPLQDGSSCECGPGSYQRDVVDSGACSLCLKGSYQPEALQTNCINCPIGTYKRNKR